MSAKAITLSVEDASTLVVDALVASSTDEVNARAVASALVAAQMDGLSGHGLSRVPSYAAQAASGKVDGFATALVSETTGNALRIDAANGFAYPALELARREICSRINEAGVVCAAVFNSHHFGAAGFHVEQLASQGLVAIIVGNSPKAIAPWGGNTALFGTNPIAFAAPRNDNPPLVIDLSLSKVARGKVLVAAQNHEPIPDDWALDQQGNPTTDANAALQGTMLPMGDAKGAQLVLMVELLAAALTGSNFGFEASSFFDAEGNSPGVGQLLIAFKPQPLSGGQFDSRIENLIEAMLVQEGVRLPGARRYRIRDQAATAGLSLPVALFEEIKALSCV